MKVNDLEIRKIEILKTISLFENAGTDVLVALARACDICEFKKGDIIYHEGDSPDSVYFVSKGKIKIFGSSISGKIIVAHLSKGANIIGLENIYTGKRRWLSAQTYNSASALSIKRHDFISFMKNNPELLLKIMELMEPVFQDIFNRFRSMVAYSVERRVINYIFDLYKQYGALLPFSNEEIASLIGTSRETVGRVINRLTIQNIVEKHHAQIKIIDRQGLINLRMPNYIPQDTIPT